MPISRREFLKGMGVVAGSTGIALSGSQRLIPYLIQPEEIVPGVSTWYATSCRECPAGCGMVVRNRESRAVKCEGNPIHPIAQGTLCSRGQAALQGLYNPDRIPSPKRRNPNGSYTDVSWDKAISSVADVLAAGKRIAIITDLQSGSLGTLMQAWLSAFGSDRFLMYEPVNYESAKRAFGGVIPSLNIAGSDCIVSFGCDFLETWVSPIEYAHAFTRMRRVVNGTRGRFIYVGPRISMTAAKADIRVIVPPGAEVAVASVLKGGSAGGVADKYGLDINTLTEAAGLVAGSRSLLALPGWTAASAQAALEMNTTGASALIDTTRPHAVSKLAAESDMRALIDDMNAGLVDVLIVIGANPVYGMPKSSGFDKALELVPNVISMTNYMDETSALAHWLLPSNTPLESWGDYEPYPDVRNLIQPTTGQPFNTRDTGDILMELADKAGVNRTAVFKAANYYEFLRARWNQPVGASDTAWEELLRRGGVWPGSSRGTPSLPSTGYNTLADFQYYDGPPSAPSPMPASEMEATGLGTARAVQAGTAISNKPSSKKLKNIIYPHTYLYDGRGANRSWLQENPEPVTKIVWHAWAEINPGTASELDVNTGDMIRISLGKESVELPVYVWRGVALGVIATPTGQGHSGYGQFADDTGDNILKLSGPGVRTVSVSKLGNSIWLPRIKGSHHQNDRDIVQTTPIDKPAHRAKPIIMPLPEGYTKRDFYPPHKYAVHRWAMVVDLNKCIGCHACVTACYAENNLATVGPTEIWRRREMSWVRIDRYFDWDHPAAPIVFQPMLCQHCDAAPCEPVCPVFAASHSDEGLNMQVYNRCVGTRYCSNNCPYKVRRFNWYDYKWPEPLNWQLNPDVTVRCRGVMEKCTFCIQRIREAEIVAKREGRKVRDGDITPACVGTCPTGVYVFGDLKDKNSRVSRLIADDPRAYQVLQNLNTKPAVIYLKQIIG